MNHARPGTATSPRITAALVVWRVSAHWCFMLVSILVLFAMPVPAQAQACWSPGATGLDFGPVSIDRPTDASGTVTITCQSGASPAFVRFCIYVPDGAPLPGIAPRRMSNYNGAELRYDLFSDPARTAIIGPPPTGGGYAVYSGTLTVPGAYANASISMPYYGRVPAGQSVPAGVFQSQIENAIIAWRFGTAGDPPSCEGGGTSAFYLGVRTEVPSACHIGLATDLDFGSVAALSADHDGKSTIIVRCPVGTPWSVGLSDGLHAAAGARHMANAAGDRVRYELHKDASMAMRWGNTGSELLTGTGAGIAVPLSLEVHGRVPAQPARPPGAYADTVTVVLTY